MTPKSGRDLEPERMHNVGPGLRRAARRLLETLDSFFGGKDDGV